MHTIPRHIIYIARERRRSVSGDKTGIVGSRCGDVVANGSVVGLKREASIRIGSCCFSATVYGRSVSVRDVSDYRVNIDGTISDVCRSYETGIPYRTGDFYTVLTVIIFFTLGLISFRISSDWGRVVSDADCFTDRLVWLILVSGVVRASGFGSLSDSCNDISYIGGNTVDIIPIVS